LSPRVHVALALALAACDDSSGGAAPAARSEQVIATGTPTASAPPSSPAEAHASPAPRKGKLCEGDGNSRGRSLPKGNLAHVEASGAPALDPGILSARGAWTWINFWAAWCGPCKEEMPRLMAWQDKLAKAGTPVHVVFVSLDDDRRQLQDFLEGQPQDGVRSSLWLPEGASRSAVLAGLRMKSAPELPEQALVDKTGRVRCFVQGAVDDGDFAEMADLVSR